MLLYDFLLLLPAGIDVTIKWIGDKRPKNVVCDPHLKFRTGKRKTNLAHLCEVGDDDSDAKIAARILLVKPLWSTRELYIEAF